MIECDILIFGNGFAANAFLTLLSDSGYSSIILDKTRKANAIWFENNQSSFIDKMETLVPGMDQKNIFFPCSQYTSAWSTTVPDHSSTVQRYNFDKTDLVNQLKANSHTPVYLYNRIDSADFDGHRWHIHIESKTNISLPIKAKLVIDASGRNSNWAAKYQSKHIYLDDHIGLSAIYTYEATDQRTMFAIETIAHGWWYMIKLKDSIQVTFITRHDRAYFNFISQFNQAIEDSYYVKGYVHNKSMVAPVWVQDTRSGILQYTAGNQWMAIGDAAFTSDPLCGQGNEIILDQLIIARNFACHFFEQNKFDFRGYDKHMHSVFFEHQKRLQLYYLMEQRWPDSLFWK